MPTKTYYVNGFDNTYFDWIKIGTSPYLSTQNQPTDYVYKVARGVGKKIGDFSFPNSGAENANTLTDVKVYIYGKTGEDPDLGQNSITFGVHDGSSYTEFIHTPGTSWGWTSKSIFSKINTWAKLDACKIYLRTTITTADHYAYADCMYLEATYTEAGGATKTIGFII